MRTARTLPSNIDRGRAASAIAMRPASSPSPRVFNVEWYADIGHPQSAIRIHSSMSAL
jgi:hypothetical protein